MMTNNEHIKQATTNLYQNCFKKAYEILHKYQDEPKIQL